MLNNNYTRPSALAETRGCYQLAQGQSLLSPNSASIALKVAVAWQGGEAACRLVLYYRGMLRKANDTPASRPLLSP